MKIEAGDIVIATGPIQRVDSKSFMRENETAVVDRVYNSKLGPNQVVDITPTSGDRLPMIDIVVQESNPILRTVWRGTHDRTKTPDHSAP